ncbi:hypothetical protein ME799_19120 [Lactobacillus delbrueckii]|uniref:hypothetical protein n=2 Tax=Bacteria TaxID=2 RepID=UPI00155DCCF9|nr:hypothetical protein [Lactobacillus delbrueckii]GHN48306.1 hypothetical protein ME799_19120 [Lactobacillus delbrueckii]
MLTTLAMYSGKEIKLFKSAGLTKLFMLDTSFRKQASKKSLLSLAVSSFFNFQARPASSCAVAFNTIKLLTSETFLKNTLTPYWLKA